MIDDIIWGVKRGVMLALGFCLWITVLYLLKGGDVFARQHVTYGGMIGAYLGLGLVAGSIVGALRRFATSEGGSFLVGLAAGIPIAIGITVAVSGSPKNWPPAATRFFIPVYGIAAGWFIGNELNKARLRKLDRES